MGARVYALGHSDPELIRLETQARLIDPFTRSYFSQAGLSTRMRVLDLGSGGGHTAFVAAGLVGPDGSVVGVDRVAKSVATARDNALARRIEHVTFLEGDPATMEFGERFDAVVGRYVLIFQTDPAAWLSAVARHLKPGGILVFHEPDGSFWRSWPAAPYYDRCLAQVLETFRATGCITDIAGRLRGFFRAAGLASPTMRFEAVIGDAEAAADWLDVLGGMAISLRPAMERLGIASTAQIDPATVVAALREDVANRDSTIIGRVEVGAWVRV